MNITITRIVVGALALVTGFSATAANDSESSTSAKSRVSRPAISGQWYDGDSTRHQLFACAMGAVNDTSGGRPDPSSLLLPNGTGNTTLKGLGAWLRFKLNFPQTVGLVTVKPNRLRISAPVSAPSDRFAVEVADADDGPWRVVVSEVTLPSDGQWHTVDWPATPAQWVRLRNLNSGWFVLNALEFWGEVEQDAAAAQFVPGALNTAAEYAQIKQRAALAGTPQAVALAALKKDKQARSDYTPHPVAAMQLNYYGINSTGHREFVEQDGEAIYKLALMAVCTGEARYAAKVRELWAVWADTVRSAEGGNLPLESAWGLSSFLRAGAVIKATQSDWDGTVEKRFLDMAHRFLVPGMEQRRGLKNQNNWGTSIYEASAMAIFHGDRYQFNRAIYRWKQQLEKDSLPSGEIGETCRDVTHANFGVGGYVNLAEIARVQNPQQLPALDLYGHLDRRLLAVLEYHAQINNIGQAVQPAPTNFTKRHEWNGMLVNINKKKPVTGGPGGATALGCYEMGFNHYHNRLGLPMPQLQPRIEFNRMNGKTDDYTFHWGMGTLTHADLK